MSFLPDTPNNSIELIPSLISCSHFSITLSVDSLYCPLRDFISFFTLLPSHTNIGYITIKPSLEREKKLSDIKKINEGVKLITDDFPNLIYIDIYEMLLVNGEVTSKFLLQDGLHLNKKGYKILTKAVTEMIIN